MYRQFLNYKNFIKNNMRRAVIPISATVFSIAVVQGMTLRSEYRTSRQLDPPKGPNFGFEKLKSKLIDWKENIIESVSLEDDDHILKKGLNRIRQIIENRLKEKKTELSMGEEGSIEDNNNNNINNFGNNNNRDKKISSIRRKIQLLVMGDSLVAGVGCDKAHASPTLPAFFSEDIKYFFKRGC